MTISAVSFQTVNNSGDQIIITPLAIHPWRQRLNTIGQRTIILGISFLLALMPFHAAWVVIAGTAWGQPSLIAIWKEVLLVILLGLAATMVVINRSYQKFNRLDSWLVVGIIGCGLVSSLLNRQFGLVFLAGIKTTILPLLAFLLAQTVNHRLRDRQLAWLLLVPAFIVSGLALWQFFFIPTGFLQSLGYTAQTILPLQGVHPDFDFYRSFATLGGPNQLGTYLIIPATVFLAYAINSKARLMRIVSSLGYVGVVLASMTTFSRSALLGLVVASFVVVIVSAPRRWRWWIIAVTFLALMVIALTASLITTQSSTSPIGRFLVRGDVTESGIQGGDSGHIVAVQEGWRQVRAHPLGLGIGSAGPASFFGQRPLITENWYLQIALETGWLGLLLILVLYGHIMLESRRTRSHAPLHTALIAAFSGLMIASFFLHSLADSTVAYLLMLMAGIIVGRRGHHA
ncbi:O-antigen ligase family protein [Candidatus Saccharibacteria bacterium]|nr:O-antigen ligase family protein [Candidatus Saccharibacteria bacterium]